MKVGVAFGGGARPSVVVELARQAELAGAESFWVTEGAAGDAFALLAGAARATSRITLGTAVVSVFVRSPSLLAMSALTVAELSGNRFVLGLGPGHREQVEAEHGVEYRNPVARLTDVLEVVRALEHHADIGRHELSNGAVIEGLRLRMDGVAPCRLPIVVGATGPKMIALAGERADGILLVWRTPEEVREIRAAIPPSCRLALLAHCAVGDSPQACAEALTAARENHSRFGRYRTWFEQQSNWGAIELPAGGDLRVALAAYADAGLDEIVLLPLPAGIPLREAFSRLHDQLPGVT